VNPRNGALSLVLAAAVAVAADGPTLEVGEFSKARPGAELPAGWQPLTFPGVARHTRYRLVDDGGRTVLRADADASASGLARRIEADPQAYPVLAWRWKIAGVIDKADATRKSGDDYAARVYVAFRYDPARASLSERSKYGLARLVYGEYPPHSALNYVWDNRLPGETVLPNAYNERSRIVVVRSGNADAGRWRDEARNVLADYRRAFGEEPPPIAAIAVMSDADDTGASATAWFGDIALRRAP
jgi:hypothetical protein